jgi:hypothetical protein
MTKLGDKKHERGDGTGRTTLKNPEKISSNGSLNPLNASSTNICSLARS